MTFKLGEKIEQAGSTPSPSSHGYAWYEVWKLAISQPSTKTFEQIAADTNASAYRINLWIIVGTFCILIMLTPGGPHLLLTSASYLLTFLGIEIFSWDAEARAAAELASHLVLLPLAGGVLGGPVALFVYTAIIQAEARLFGGKGKYFQLAYAYAAILAPLGLISFLISFLPVAKELLFTAVLLYAGMLSLIALKAINRISYRNAFVASLFVGGFLLFGGLAVGASIYVFVFYVIGPLIWFLKLFFFDWDGFAQLKRFWLDESEPDL